MSAGATLISIMVGIIGLLLRHSASTEKKLITISIESAMAVAHNASNKLSEEINLRHAQAITLTQYEGNFKALQATLDQLRDKDDEQDRRFEEINRAASRLKERLDKGSRTTSGQIQSGLIRRDDPPTDPPYDPGPMRPRMPTHRGRRE